MQKKSVLVTGGGGYVGSRLVPHLLSLGHRVRVLDSFLYGESCLSSLEQAKEFAEWKSRFEVVRGDIREPSTVTQSLKGCDSVIHLAAISNDPTGEVDETLTRQVNFDAVGLLIAKAKELGIQRFINASSSSVFGLKNEKDVVESLEPEPLTYYSKYKMLSEWLVLTAHDSNFCTVNIRPATICGFSPRQRFDLTVNKLTADAVRQKKITVHGGEQRRPNIGMTDMINLYGMMLQLPAATIGRKTFNFGFENLKIIEIAQLVRDVVADPEIKIEVTDTLDKRDYHISSKKMVEALDYKQVSSIRQEVLNLKSALADHYPDINAPEFYNMKVMNLQRQPSSYRWDAF